MGKISELLNSIEGRIVVLVITKKDNGSTTSNNMLEVAKEFDIPCYMISTKKSFIGSEDIKGNEITIHNYDGSGRKLVINPKNTVAFIRGTALDKAGEALVNTLESVGVFTINNLSRMKLAQNKLSLGNLLTSHNIKMPKTSFVADISSLEIAHEQIGGNFPVVIKTLTGAEGIGVAIAESMRSLKSMVQALWGQKADILIQEFLEADGDVRTLVLDGEIVAAMKRSKVDGDFRSNVALGGKYAPYDLSEKEKEVILKVAKQYGGYYFGADTMLVNGEVYVIEVNGSPGSGGSYKSQYQTSSGRVLTGKELIQEVFKHIRLKSNWKPEFKRIGYSEKLEIETIGQCLAKVDTGNDSFNTIHATDIEEVDGMIKFKTINDVELELPLERTVLVRTSSQHVERRYVVKMNFSSGKYKFENIDFNLCDRTNNEYPVLIGNKFLTQQRFVVNPAEDFLLESKQSRIGHLLK